MHIQRRTSIPATLAFLFVIAVLAIGPASAQDISPVTPPFNPGAAPVDNGREVSPAKSEESLAPITAVVVSPEDQGCSSSSLIWEHLNSNWADYGTTSITIIYDIPALCGGTITYDALAASGANVLILTNLGDGRQLTPDETAAIYQYAQEGHALIGTYILFQADEDDNRALAPLFGLREDLDYTTVSITPSFNLLKPSHDLFRKIANPYVSTGWPHTQVPTDLTWDASDLDGAFFLARTTDSSGAITFYSNPDYSAIYFSHMLEYQGSLVDEQIFYNAITYSDAIKAVMVKSWGGCSSGSLVWDDLNANWANYGDIPIEIDYSNPQLCSGDVTYDELVNSGADVIILGDPAGAPQQFSPADVAAIQQYMVEGHNLIGTYSLFQFNTTDNRILAPLFGLRADIEYSSGTMASTEYDLLSPGSPLFRNLPDPYTTGGYSESQQPLDGTWDPDDLAGADKVAGTAANDAAIFIYDQPAYDAIYITSMPEYEGGVQDEQFLYNAITYPVYKHSVYLPVIGRGYSLPTTHIWEGDALPTGDQDVWEFEANPGTFFNVFVDTISLDTAYDIEACLSTSPSSVDCFAFGDDNGPCSYPPPAFGCPAINVTLPEDADGLYYLLIESGGGSSGFVGPVGNYRATVTPSKPLGAFMLVLDNVLGTFKLPK